METGKGRQQFPFLKRHGGERTIDTLRFLKYLMKGYDFTTRRFEITKKLKPFINFYVLMDNDFGVLVACETNHIKQSNIKIVKWLPK